MRERARQGLVRGWSGWDCLAGIVAIVLGAALVFMFPKHDAEKQLLEQYERVDEAASAEAHPAL